MRRQHRRVRLRLPVRLRWAAPLGQKTENCETRNASRGGLLLECSEHHGVGMPLWVTFPYDSALPEGQPEVLARVMRCEDCREDNRVITTVAVHFESTLRSHPVVSSHARETTHAPNNRRPLAIPIRVRPERVPWFEEVMTLDVSSESLRFLTNRVYSPGDVLRVSFTQPGASPWRGEGEQAARIVRVEQLPGGASLAVTVQRIPS